MSPSHQAFPHGAGVTMAQLTNDLHGTLHGLRSTEPISWVPAVGGWIVSGREEAIAIMRDAETFTVDDPRFTTARVIGQSMLSTDGAEHQRHRQPFVEPFQRASIRVNVEPWLDERARQLVRSIADLASVELRSTLAAPFATEVIVRTLGLIDVDPAELLGWYRQIVATVESTAAAAEHAPGSTGATGSTGENGRHAYHRLAAIVERTIATSDTSFLKQAVDDGLSLAEVSSNAAVIMFGAIETSEGATANALHHLFTTPDALAAVTADRSLVANAVEESLRLEPAAASVHRYATADVRLGRAAISAGDFVDVSLAGANRDPSVFPEPDRFDIARENASQHLTFARGPHACIGIHLARLETIAMVRAVIECLPHLLFDATASSPPTGSVFRKPPAVTLVEPQRQTR